jgi:hypothetical protein
VRTAFSSAPNSLFDPAQKSTATRIIALLSKCSRTLSQVEDGRCPWFDVSAKVQARSRMSHCTLQCFQEFEPMDRPPVHELRRPVKTWRPVDGCGHAMFGWSMEEEEKLEFTITVSWRRKDGSIAPTQLGTLDRGACRSGRRCGVCNSRTPSQFSGGYKRLWSANNCSGTGKLCGPVLAVIVGAEAKLDELRSYLYANRQSWNTPKHTGTESVFGPPMWRAQSIN